MWNREWESLKILPKSLGILLAARKIGPTFGFESTASHWRMKTQICLEKVIKKTYRKSTIDFCSDSFRLSEVMWASMIIFSDQSFKSGELYIVLV